jgi:hypothetical protein
MNPLWQRKYILCHKASKKGEKMKRFKPLSGRKTTKKDMLDSFEGKVLEKKIQELAVLFNNDSSIIDPVINEIAQEIDILLTTVEPINDIDELQYLLAIIYTQLKSKWIQYNIKINYMVEEGKDPLDADIYKASALTHVLDLVEPLTHPEAVQTVTMTLGKRLREIELVA